MDEMKSALEIAMEKVAQIGEPTEEERLKWKYVPEGEQLAARYLKENLNLAAEVARYPENGRGFVIQGASATLIRNIQLPETEQAKKANKKAMDGLKDLKTDKINVENIFSQIRHLFNHYAEQGEQQ